MTLPCFTNKKPLFLLLNFVSLNTRHFWQFDHCFYLWQRPARPVRTVQLGWLSAATQKLSVQPRRRKKIKNGGILCYSGADKKQLFLTHFSYFRPNSWPILLRIIKFICDLMRKSVRRSLTDSNLYILLLRNKYMHDTHTCKIRIFKIHK